MNTVKRDTPNPILTIGAVAIILALALISSRTNWLPRSYAIGLAIGFVLLFRLLSRRSALSARTRRQQELERLKKTPVLGLDD